MSAPFVHLKVHTEFSLVDSVVRIKPLMQKVAESGMPAVALTDQSNLFAMVKFFRAALDKGIKPIFGVDAWVQDAEAAARVTLLCQNDAGYANLAELISKSFIDGQKLGKAYMHPEWLAEHNEGLIVLSGGAHGVLGNNLINNHKRKLEKELKFWQSNFEDRFYIELHRTGREYENTHLHKAVELAAKQQIPVVATNDVRFLSPTDFGAHEARVCIHDSFTLNDPTRPKNYTDQQYLKTPEEMVALFSDIPSAIENSVEIAKRCNMHLELGKSVLPEFPIPQEHTTETWIESESRLGLKKRFDSGIIVVPEDATPEQLAEQQKVYSDRLDIELGVINEMGFPGYFLIVADFIRWARENDVPVGPGRGSGAGSLVAFALKITDIDPLRYDLLFERFLNPERVSMPDFDVDFCMDKRDSVIEYVAEQYGREKVSQIITYGTMAAKAVVRDVGRVLGHPYGFVDRIAKLIPFEVKMTLDKALEQEEELRNLYEQDEEVAALIDLAKKLEGLSRNAGKHAGGVVIAPTKLTDFSALYCEPGGKNLVTQFDKDDVESVGLVKFDFLGLRTLTIIDWAVKAINASRGEDQDVLDINQIPLDDKATFDLLSNKQTTAVFQLESGGLKDLIGKLKPTEFEDIIALVALYRPGPLQSGMVDDYVARRHGRAQVHYPHPSLEGLLKPTYGIILYQEQVMQIAQVLGGFTLGAADILRRAMGKKKEKEMDQQREFFVKGCLENDIDERTSTYIFDLIQNFAKYGFNKSHSAAYALLSYQTAWLKTHHAAAFMASVLSSDMDNTDKIVTLIDECRQLKLEVLPPDVNHSGLAFSRVDDTQVRYGLGAIKGVGEGAINNFLEERERNGPFKSLDDICRRVDGSKTSKRVLEAMIKAGAMDSLGANRASSLAWLPQAIQRSEQHARDLEAGQNDMFGGAAAVIEDEPINKIDEWVERERLQNERDTLGLYLTGHPIQEYLHEIKAFTTCPISQVQSITDRVASQGGGAEKQVVIAGLVVGVNVRNGRRGKFCIMTLDDRSGRVEVGLFGAMWEEYGELVVKDRILVINGTIKQDNFSGRNSLRATEVFDIEQARARYARFIEVGLHRSQVQNGFIQDLASTIEPYKNGDCAVVIKYDNGDATAELKLGKEWSVLPTDDCIGRLRNMMGDGKVVVHYITEKKEGAAA